MKVELMKPPHFAPYLYTRFVKQTYVFSHMLTFNKIVKSLSSLIFLSIFKIHIYFHITHQKQSHFVFHLCDDG